MVKIVEVEDSDDEDLVKEEEWKRLGEATAKLGFDGSSESRGGLHDLAGKKDFQERVLCIDEDEGAGWAEHGQGQQDSDDEVLNGESTASGRPGIGIGFVSPAGPPSHGDGEEHEDVDVDELDVSVVMAEAKVTRKEALNALQCNAMDAVDAIIWLREGASKVRKVPIVFGTSEDEAVWVPFPPPPLREPAPTAVALEEVQGNKCAPPPLRPAAQQIPMPRHGKGSRLKEEEEEEEHDERTKRKDAVDHGESDKEAESVAGTAQSKADAVASEALARIAEASKARGALEGAAARELCGHRAPVNKTDLIHKLKALRGDDRALLAYLPLVKPSQLCKLLGSGLVESDLLEVIGAAAACCAASPITAENRGVSFGLVRGIGQVARSHITVAMLGSMERAKVDELLSRLKPDGRSDVYTLEEWEAAVSCLVKWP